MTAPPCPLSSRPCPFPTGLTPRGGGGNSDWMVAGEFCRKYRFNRNTILGMIRKKRLRAEKIPAPFSLGYQWVVFVPGALEHLKSFRSKPRNHNIGPKDLESGISLETWARFEEVWEDFCAGRCWPTPFGRKKPAWIYRIIDPHIPTTRVRRADPRPPELRKGKAWRGESAA